MNILTALKSGSYRMMRAWKNVLLVWFVMLLLITAVVSPIRGTLQSGFGASMITEKLTSGIFPEAFTDLGPVFTGILSAFGRGFFTLILVSFLLNAFFTGGLFDSVRAEAGERTVKEFMKGCVTNFWPYTLILVIIGFMIFFTVLLISVVSGIFIDMLGKNEEIVIFRVTVIAVSVFILLLPVILLVADYARAWVAANAGAGVFRAIGKGFSNTFRKLATSWVVMLILLFINTLFLWFVLAVITRITPQSGTGIFILFLLSQVLFIVKLMLKLLRYSVVTCIMEDASLSQISPQI